MNLDRVLTHEKTKMPLGAKLTQNDFKCNFKMDFDIELKWKLIHTIWQDPNKFLKIERNFNHRKWLKCPWGLNWLKKMTQLIFSEMNSDMSLKQGLIQTNLKDSNNFQG